MSCMNFYRSFLHPSPSNHVIMDYRSKMVAAIQKSLKAGTLRDNKMLLEFSSDVYSFMFQGKGLKNRNGWQLMIHCEKACVSMRGDGVMNVRHRTSCSVIIHANVWSFGCS